MKKALKNNLRRSQRDYSLAFKLSVVRQVEKGELTYKQAQSHYGIQGRSTVLVWLRKLGNLDWSLPKQYTMNKHIDPSPEQRIKLLEKALKDEQDRNLVYKTMFEIMEKEYGNGCAKKAFIQRLREKGIISLSKVCKLFGISRQGYYKKLNRIHSRLLELQQVKQEVLKERMYLPRLGTRKLYFILKERFNAQHIKIGRDALFNFLRSEHLLIKPARSYIKTTNSKHWLHKYPNLLKEKKAIRAEEIWVSDITYIQTHEKTAYLSLVTDAWSRKIIGFHLHHDLSTDGVAKALKMAIKSRKSHLPLIHHSDRGVQYCSNQYQEIQRKNNITCSMTDGYDCYQNALAERINGILKNEFLISKPKNIKQANTMIRQSVKLYNNRRPHTALKYKTPGQVHKQKILT
ncbi:IS3 family transposase [Sphingobacterium sp. MYb382]|uniref:IS3 family transposase n=1 Tax=Sphingobacterium sp. MYb382 TaxID=2745278 RepID=UPI00403FB11A